MVETLTFWYRNHRGEISQRNVTKPEKIWFGSTEWHPKPQWLMTAWDIDKDALRDFAFKDIINDSAVEDAKLLDFAEETARKSRTGISFDWVPAVMGAPGGFRAMRRAMIGEPAKTLRGAIKKLRTEIEGKGHRP